MNLDLEGKKVLVTGGTRGIGKAIKQALQQEGADVYDFSKTTNVDLMTHEGIDFACKYMYQFDILINNVGGCGTCEYPDWRIAMEKNYGITNQLTMAYLMTKRKWGRVITISSFYGKEKGPNPWFTATKAAQIAYMKSLAGKYKGITFNTICPGIINTTKSNKQFAMRNNLQLGEPEDIANIVTFLCSPLASHINGACITVDGGDSFSF